MQHPSPSWSLAFRPILANDSTLVTAPTYTRAYLERGLRLARRPSHLIMTVQSSSNVPQTHNVSTCLQGQALRERVTTPICSNDSSLSTHKRPYRTRPKFPLSTGLITPAQCQSGFACQCRRAEQWLEPQSQNSD